MQKKIILILFISFLGLAFKSTALKTSKDSPKILFNTDSTTQNTDSLAICVLQGWMNYLRVVLSEDECLPRNEASEVELNSGSLQSDFFVPNMVGYWMLAAVLSYEVKEIHPSLTMGFDQQELLNKLYCIMDALDNILENHAYIDPVTGKKALYQVHKITGEAPRTDDFEKTVSMLDNMFLVTALQAVANWSQDIDFMLANRINTTLEEFDMSMWFKDNYWYLGGPENPIGIDKVDRIVSESRLIYVAALARGESDLGKFVYAINKSRSLSQEFTSSQGVYVEYLPVFGRALEKWVVTSFLSTELDTKFGCNTLLPLLETQEEIKCSLSLVSNEPTPVGDGFGGFLELGISPSESGSTYQNVNILIPPAVMMQAGVMANIHPLAECNFREAMQVLADSSQLTSEWGPANYLDFGTGLVNMDNPLRGTLEIEQGTVALLNMLLGGNYLENLLRQDANWNEAIDYYATVLDDKTILREAEHISSGVGTQMSRTNAFSGLTWKLSNVGDAVLYEIEVDYSGEYQLYVRYSNDDFLNSWDHLIISVDGEIRDSFQTENTGNFGQGWNIFTISSILDLGHLTIGTHNISIIVDQISANVELDALLFFQVDFEFSCNYESEIDSCDCLTIGVNNPPIEPDEIYVFPNPISSETNISFQLKKSQEVKLRILDATGKEIDRLVDCFLETGYHDFEWRTDKIPAGIYYLVISGNSWAVPKKMVVVK